VTPHHLISVYTYCFYVMYRRVCVYIYIYIHTIIAFITDGNLFANGTIQTGEWVNGVHVTFVDPKNKNNLNCSLSSIVLLLLVHPSPSCIHQPPPPLQLILFCHLTQHTFTSQKHLHRQPQSFRIF